MDTEKIFEFKRQMVHLLVGLCIALGVYLLEPVYGKIIAAPLILAVLFMIILPELGAELEIHHHILFHFERPKDIQHFPYRGAILYGIGVTPAILLLDVNTACAIITILSVGDSTSTIVGKSIGRIKIGHKSLEGFLAFVVFSSLAALPFIPQQPLTAVSYTILGGLFELSNISHDHVLMDDNLLIPIGLTVIALLF